VGVSLSSQTIEILHMSSNIKHSLAMWFFFVSVAAHFSSVANKRMHFAMNWYSFVFPNTALTTSTFAVATALNGNRAFRIVGCILTVAIIITWIFVFGMMIRAVYLKQVLWPQMQEDRDEGGWGKDGKKRKGDVRSAFQSRQASFLGFRRDDESNSNSPVSPVSPTSGETTPIGEMEMKMKDSERSQAGWMGLARLGQHRDRRRGFKNGSAGQLNENAELTRIERMEKDVNPGA
jgi:hypothetical protein